MSLGLLLVLCVLPLAASAGASRAIWTWEAESYAMVEDPAVADEAVAYLKSQHIDTVYLYADAYRGRNLIVDHLLGGVWIAAMGFNALPSALMLSMMAMDSMIAGGWRLMLRGVVTHALGAVLGVLMLGWLYALRKEALQWQ